jgi:lysozyme
VEINKAGIDIIKYWERNPKTNDFYPKAYKDEEGVWTIGWGSIRWDMKTPVKSGDTITLDEADRQLLKEVQRIEDAITSSVKVPLTSNQFSSLCSLFYNIGIGWCTGVGHAQATFIKNLNKGKYDLVPNGILQFTRGAVSGSHYSGLANRRRSEVKLWLTPDNENNPLPEPEPASTTGEEDTKACVMPQAVTMAPSSTAMEVITSSPTVGAAGIGVAAAIVKVAAGAAVVVTEAGQQISATKDASGPFAELFSTLHISIESVTVGIILASLLFVIIRRVAQRTGVV